jgi:hypothetical protein
MQNSDTFWAYRPGYANPATGKPVMSQFPVRDKALYLADGWVETSVDGPISESATPPVVNAPESATPPVVNAPESATPPVVDMGLPQLRELAAKINGEGGNINTNLRRKELAEEILKYQNV